MTRPLTISQLEDNLYDLLDKDRRVKCRQKILVEPEGTTITFPVSGTTYGYAYGIGTRTGETAEQVLDRIMERINTDRRIDGIPDEPPIPVNVPVALTAGALRERLGAVPPEARLYVYIDPDGVRIRAEYSATSSDVGHQVILSSPVRLSAGGPAA